MTPPRRKAPRREFVAASGGKGLEMEEIFSVYKELREEDGRPYGGCYVRAVLDLWAQDNKWGKRINCTLKGVQFIKDGDAFSASTPAQDEDFADISDTGDDGA